MVMYKDYRQATEEAARCQSHYGEPFEVRWISHRDMGEGWVIFREGEPLPSYCSEAPIPAAAVRPL